MMDYKSAYLVSSNGLLSHEATLPDAEAKAAYWRGSTIYVRHDLMHDAQLMDAVYRAMLNEATYQDAKGYSPTHPVSAWLLIMRKELREATDAWCTSRGDRAALEEILQVMTVGMRCLMQHGVVERES